MQLINEPASQAQLIVPMLAFIVGIVTFAAVHHLLIGVRRPEDRVHLLFAGMCAAVAVWAATGVSLYTAGDFEAFVSARRARLALGNGAGAFLVWFLAYYTGVKPRRFLWAVVVFHSVLIVWELARPYGASLDPGALVFVELPWGERLSTWRGPGGADRLVPLLSLLVDFGFGFWASFRLWRMGRGREAIPVLVALAVLGAGLFDLYDLVLGPMPSSEVAFLGLIVVMSLAASDRVVEASVMKDALAESEQRLRTLVETAPEAVLLLDSESGAALEANDRALELFQLTRTRFIHSHPIRMAPTEQSPGEASSVVFEHRRREAIQGGRPVFRWTVRGGRGREVPCEARLVKLPGSDPSMLRLSLVDLQSMEEAEARQSELEAQLHRSQRLEAVGRLTGGVAHDFNNFLTVVQGNIEVVLEDGDLDSQEARELLTQAFEASHRGGELTRRLLAFSRQQTLEPSPIDLQGLMADLVRLLDRTLGEDIEIETVVPDNLPDFSADAGQLESALVNLAINARDAMPGGGRLTLTAADVQVPEDGSDWPDVAAGPAIVISVTDTGHGMDDRTVGRAVEPFFSTKEVGEGSGLGLSMVYGFVTQSGGAMSIDSEVGEGTTIRLLFPSRHGGGSPPVSA